ncbi:hypothetical protein CAEBREN_16453 [Caenorhabditis brenneri]|uniref:Chromo domain-containing protein n=1 Tax=Caenorhabditis brenneri TaxID=135651 RepID=G0NFF9_CAEBE|nr:hypothetical protein CAEBREN_16453 [Caenorhabditis brenneri]
MAANGYMEDEISGEEIEVEDGKCVVDGVDTWVVRDIIDMRFNQNWKAIQFNVSWEDGDTTWEPLSSFSEGLDHVMIKEFKLKNLEKYEALLQEEKEAREAEPENEEEEEFDEVEGEEEEENENDED